MNNSRSITNNFQSLCFSAIINDFCSKCNPNKNLNVICNHLDVNSYHHLYDDDMLSNFGTNIIKKNRTKIKKRNEII